MVLIIDRAFRRGYDEEDDVPCILHDSPIGPVPVSFTECGNFHIFFVTLIEKRGIDGAYGDPLDPLGTESHPANLGVKAQWQKWNYPPNDSTRSRARTHAPRLDISLILSLSGPRSGLWYFGRRTDDQSRTGLTSAVQRNTHTICDETNFLLKPITCRCEKVQSG